jgi:hypothetical protein
VPSSEVAHEQERRKSHAEQVAAWFKAHPLMWIGTADLEKLGGRNAWRTRVSECRTKLHMNIENKQSRSTGAVISLYRYVPWEPLGRDASERIQQKSLF